MAGLFTTPEQVRRAQQQRIMEQSQVYDNPIARAAYQANAGLVGSIGGLFGAQPQGVAQAQKIQDISSQVKLDEQADPYGYYTDLARRLINSGMTQAGNEALAMAQKVKPSAPKARELSTEGYKEIMKATAASRTASSNVTRANSLMNKYENLKVPGGLTATIGGFFTRLFGTQDEVSAARTEFQNLINTAVISNLPPGPATDKDIEVIQQGFPTSKWSNQQVQEWLTTYRDLAEYQQLYERERAKYMTANGGLDVGFDEAFREQALKIRQQQEARRQQTAPQVEKKATENAATANQPAVAFNPSAIPSREGEFPTTADAPNVGAAPGTMRVAPPPRLQAIPSGDRLTQQQFEEQTNPFSL